MDTNCFIKSSFMLLYTITDDELRNAFKSIFKEENGFYCVVPQIDQSTICFNYEPNHPMRTPNSVIEDILKSCKKEEIDTTKFSKGIDSIYLVFPRKLDGKDEAKLELYKIEIM